MKNKIKYLKKQNVMKMHWAIILIRGTFLQDRPQGGFFSELLPTKLSSAGLSGKGSALCDHT